MLLLDPAFVRELEVLRRRLDIRARSGGAGDHLARRKGSSAEFQEHRAYAPGDDLRRIDWAAYARTGEPVLKLFRAEEDVILRVLCDASRSMDFPERGPTKLEVARRLAAAAGYLALARSERAQVLVAGEGVEREHVPARGRSGLPKLLRELDAVVPSGRTDLAKAIDGAVERSARPGMLVVTSDFLDQGPWGAALRRATARGHDVALFHVVAPEETDPELEGDWALEDAETGKVVEVSLGPEALDAYVVRFAALCEDLRAFAKKNGATYVRVRTDDALEDALRRFAARATDG